MLRLSAGFAGLALLSACAGGAHTAGLSASYYESHAAGNYQPPGPANDPWGPYIKIAASRFDVPDTWIRQVMKVESGGHEYISGHLTVSPAGAMGLMQLEPETYQEMASRYGLGKDPFNPYNNIMAGTAYIHEMYAIYGSPGFLAAYNAGPGRVDSFMNYHQPLPQETNNYVAMIAPQIQGVYPQHRSEADQLALNTEPEGSGAGILPPGVSPGPLPTPGSPGAPGTPLAPVEVAALAPPANEQSDSAADPAPAAPRAGGFSIIPSAMADTPPPQMQVAQVQAAQVQSAQVQAAQGVAVATPVISQQPLPVVAAAPALAPPPYVPAVAPPYHPPLDRAVVTTTPFHAAPPALQAGGWAVQVGAYNTADKAKAALGIAELSAVQTLIHARPMVASVNNGLGTVYRARFIGLPHDEAVAACARLSGGPTGCAVVPPGP